MKQYYHNKKHIQRFLWMPVLILAFGGMLLFWNSYSNAGNPKTEVQFGATFSTKYAKELGLDWKQVYLASLDDLKIRKYRIPVYWDEIERDKGNIWLEDVRWMLDEAHKRDATVFLAVGERVPRWPECHPPEWVKNMPQDESQQYELAMIERVVTEFRDHPALQRWQVENEPFFAYFGECPQPDEDFISKAVAKVKELDPKHQVIITDSGELSTWAKPAGQADIVGISMYRTTWNSLFGYFYYPLPPTYYKQKARLIAPWVDTVIVSELQVEPWTPNGILQTPLPEQAKSMNPKRLLNNIEYVQRTGFSEVYVWGIEWWYWMKETNHQPEMWDTGKTLFE